MEQMMAEQANDEPRTSTALRTRYLLATVPSALIVVFDQITKALIVNTFARGQSKEIIPGLFNLCHTRNTGVVFGMFRGRSWRFAALIMAAIIILMLLVRSIEESASRWQYVAYGLIIGGAIGNLIDRVRVGSVTDFLDYDIGRYHWSVFNVAVSAVCVGVALLLFSTITAAKRDKSDAAS